MTPTPQALEGVTVLDFTQVYLGPCATQLLGDYGAEVIKVERPGTGDLSRTSLSDPDGLDNPVFIAMNRNKRSIALDVRSEAGRKIIFELAKTADVVVSNFRAGVMERLGLGYEDLAAVNPGVVWASGTGFGESGPYAHKGGQDVIAQAYSGLMARRSDDSAPLSIYSTALCDYTTGMHLFQGILLALMARGRTGKGQKVQVNMYDSMLHSQMQEAAMQMRRGYERNWAAMPLTGVFETSDGAICMVGAFKENPLRDICVGLEIDEDLSLRPGLGDLDGQTAARGELHRIFGGRFIENTTAYWIGRLEKVDILCAPVTALADALDDPQTEANRMIVEIDHATVGPVRVLNAPIRLSGTPNEAPAAAPTIGQHSREILNRIGYPDTEIDRFVEAGVVQ